MKPFVTPDTLHFLTTYQPTTTKSDHFKPSILAFFAFGKKIIDGKNSRLLAYGTGNISGYTKSDWHDIEIKLIDHKQRATEVIVKSVDRKLKISTS